MAKKTNDSDKKEKKKGFLAAKLDKVNEESNSNAKGNAPLVDKTSYEFSPSFIYHNGLTASIVQLYARKGSNRQMTFTDVLDIIPTHPREGVNIYLMELDGVIKDDEKKSLVKENAAQSTNVIRNEDAKDKDASDRNMDQADIEDYYTYELTMDSPEPVVYYRFQLVVIGPDVESVEEQIKDLNLLLDQRHAGFKWDSVAGDQSERFKRMFAPLEKIDDGSVETATGNMYAGINFAASPGLCDAEGTVIGDDVMSLVQSAAVYDFNKSTRELAIIAIPASEKMPLYELEGSPSVSVASIVAQAAANDIAIDGHRVAHMVLNDFDYFDTTRGYMRPLTDAALRRYDVGRMTINPLQGFGEEKDVTSIFPRLTNKIVNIFDILDDFIFERGGKDGMLYKGLVNDAVYGFYLRHGLWTSDAGIHPERTTIVNIKRPEAFPTMGMLIQEFTTMEDEARNKGSQSQADVAKALHSVLSHSLDEALDVLGRPTSIEPSNAVQTYYDFKSIASTDMRQVQFINILDYVLYTLDKDDLFVIHGVDKLYKIVMNSMVAETLRAAMKRGVRVLLAYDTITTPNISPDYDGKNMCDVFSLQGPYYTDLASDVSWTLIGAMLDNELSEYARVMNNVQLSEAIKMQASARGACQALLHRDIGRVNNFIRLSTLI